MRTRVRKIHHVPSDSAYIEFDSTVFAIRYNGHDIGYLARLTDGEASALRFSARDSDDYLATDAYLTLED